MIRHGDSVTLSFKGITFILSAFFFYAIGLLYGRFSEEQINAALVGVTDLNDDDKETLASVIRRSKEYYENPEPFDQAFEEFYGDVEENKCNIEDFGFVIGRNEDDSDVLEEGLE